MSPNLSRNYLDNEVKKIISEIRADHPKDTTHPYERIGEALQKGYTMGWNDLAKLLNMPERLI